MAGVPKLLLALLVAIVAVVSALNVGTPVARAPAAADVKMSVGPAFANVHIVDDELDNLDIPTDDTLTPARGCKGCFG